MSPSDTPADRAPKGRAGRTSHFSSIALAFLFLFLSFLGVFLLPEGPPRASRRRCPDKSVSVSVLVFARWAAQPALDHVGKANGKVEEDDPEPGNEEEVDVEDEVEDVGAPVLNRRKANLRKSAAETTPTPRGPI